MKRYTQKDAIQHFNILVKLLDKETFETSMLDDQSPRYKGLEGRWFLEIRNNLYRVVEIAGELGGESHPLGNKRRTASEFCDCVYFLQNALEGRILTSEIEQYRLVQNSIKAFEGQEKKRKQCNGWNNYETWTIYCNVDQEDPNDRNYWRNEALEHYKYKNQIKEDTEISLADSLKANYEELLGEYEEINPLANQLLNASLSEVDWLEISRYLINEVLNEEEIQESQEDRDNMLKV